MAEHGTHHTQPTNNHLYICIVSHCEMCITQMQTYQQPPLNADIQKWISPAFLEHFCPFLLYTTTPHPYSSIVRPVHSLAFSSHICTIPYNTANILAMYKGTANSPKKVWHGGDNLYWECPDRYDGHLPKFCNCKLEYRRRHKHCPAPRNGNSIYIPDPMSSLVIAMPPQRSSYTF